MQHRVNRIKSGLLKILMILSFIINFSCVDGLITNPNEPIALYLTWQRDPTTTMTVQWIVFKRNDTDTLTYSGADEDKWYSVNGETVNIPGDDKYILKRIELTNLKPATDYHFRIEPGNQVYTFRTMPAILDNSFRFVAGGDIYHDKIDYVKETNLQAAAQSPQFALVGGDLAYAGDKFGFLPEGWQSWFDRMLANLDVRPAKRQRWIDWLALWKETMITPEGRLIPLIPSLGNHDVNGGYGKNASDAQFFHTFFPFPGRQGYNVLDFGNYMTLFILDSGHTNSIGGKQSRWLYEELRSREDVLYKFALYHVPAYPSVRKFKGKTSSEVRNCWVPLFDKFNLTVAFENHEHAYKRTHPLSQGRIQDGGVIFMGDGAWGVEEPRTPVTPEHSWYIAHSAAKRHVILATISENRCQMNAIDSEGQCFDEVIID